MNTTAMLKYLANDAEPEVTQLADFPANLQFQHCLVIPAYNETAEFFTRIQLGPLHNQHALCIAVINQPDNDANAEANRLLLQQLTLSGEVIWHNDNIQLLHYRGSNNYWLVIDRFSYDETRDRRIAAHEGIGKARKIGCDLAAALIARSQIRSGWIHSTDADTFLPRDYFDLPSPDEHSAAVYSFKHQNDGSNIGRATAIYEQGLDYYVKGLAWAGSPYAYHTIGSILAINAESYCHVRGFPRRNGGEAFYLLNELAKIGNIFHAGQTVRIKARESSRAPFGTGPTVATIMALTNPESDYCYYNPEVFRQLREWLSHLPAVWPEISAGREATDALPPEIGKALQAIGWQGVVQHLRKQAKSAADMEAALRNWFDAVQTLKFIHYLQEHHYPPLPLKECLAKADFIHEAFPHDGSSPH
jgi:hypothetical protein